MLKKIGDELEKKFLNKNIDVKFSYFSDDFYFFCDENNKETVKNIFNEVLTFPHSRIIIIVFIPY